MPSRFMSFAALALLAAVAQASPLAAQSKKKNCPDAVPDSVTGLMVYQRCHVDREAKVREAALRPDWNPNTSQLRDGACFSAVFRFVVDTAGLPVISTVRVVRSTDGSYAAAVQGVLDRLRYAPATLDGQAVPQEVEYTSKAAIGRVISSSPTGRPPTTMRPNC